MAEPSAAESTAEPRLQPATAADAGAIAEIYNESIEVGDATMDEVLWTDASVRAMLEAFSPREGIWMLEQDSRILGWGVIKRYSDRVGYRFACETAVYLWRSEVGRGLGTRIKLGLIERCRELGYHHMVAKIFAGNRASIDYNLRLGYELVGIQRQIGFKNGQWQDVAILQMLLGDGEPGPATDR